ncbi:flagellar biosynthetic protein FliR [Dendrosporobacter sp. 1207_IL3150]|uniref:flagellar biosynthetic protein FliR n=1 Tax=Dendrosporobacter sp. 1207_IL3150 TaxID=3084054 RepID=UPI002FDB6B0A
MDLFTIIQSSLGVFLLIFVRISGIFIVTPIFGSRNIPVYIKAGLALAISMILFPIVSQTNVVLPENVLLFTFMMISELMVGWIIGYASSFVFSAVHMAGQLLDTQVGFGIVNVFDPQSGQQVPLIGNFKYILALIVFLITNSHHLLLIALFNSFKIIPITGVVFNTALTGIIVDMVWGIFSIALKISLPVLVSLLLTDIALGILARTMPQMNIFVVGVPGKIIVGIFVLSLALPFYILFLEVAFNGMFTNIYKLLENFK